MNEQPATSETIPPARQTIRARWIFPVDRPPLENAIIEIVDGRIAAVTDSREPATTDLQNAAVIPGLVNAHTHLELSDVAQPLQPPAPFTSWLRSVMAHRRARPADADASSRVVRNGAREALLTGTTLLGDIVSADWTEVADLYDGPRRVNFLELLGLSSDRIPTQVTLARAHLERGAITPAGAQLETHIPGLSPHAPYSVHPDLFNQLVRLAQEFKAPLAVHLAETRAELELLDLGTGEFVDFLRGLGVWLPTDFPGGMRIPDYLRSLATLAHPLVIHGNYLSVFEIDFLARCETISVVYCPRTHAFFGHTPHPWRQLLARGVNVALGTDSRASNPDLSLWNELLYLCRQYPDVAPETLLEMGTIRGARALGLADELGSLTPGKSADLAIVSLPVMDSSDSYELLFDPASRVTGVVCRGRWIDYRQIVKIKFD
jgi:cytosine/adenosine deaminase-related metal-dependent hydrolase